MRATAVKYEEVAEVQEFRTTCAVKGTPKTGGSVHKPWVWSGQSGRETLADKTTNVTGPGFHSPKPKKGREQQTPIVLRQCEPESRQKETNTTVRHAPRRQSLRQPFLSKQIKAIFKAEPIKTACSTGDQQLIPQWENPQPKYQQLFFIGVSDK